MSTAAAASTTTSALTSTFTPAVSGAPQAHLRLTRRGRAVITTLAAIPLVVGAAVFAINGGGAAASAGGNAAGHFHYRVVQSGDSLWSIAERVAPNSDPRDVVARIVSLNQLSTSMVTPGQRVAIPAEYAPRS